jgi:hypothetical protein
MLNIFLLFQPIVHEVLHHIMKEMGNIPGANVIKLFTAVIYKSS